MKAELVYWHKARLQGQYVLEMAIHKVKRGARYPDGIKYGLILVDLKTGKRILMDNHHPKGPHWHLGDREIDYTFVSIDQLIIDFRMLVFQHMGVRL